MGVNKGDGVALGAPGVTCEGAPLRGAGFGNGEGARGSGRCGWRECGGGSYAWRKCGGGKQCSDSCPLTPGAGVGAHAARNNTVQSRSIIPAQRTIMLSTILELYAPYHTEDVSSSGLKREARLVPNRIGQL